MSYAWTAAGLTWFAQHATAATVGAIDGLATGELTSTTRYQVGSGFTTPSAPVATGSALTNWGGSLLSIAGTTNIINVGATLENTGTSPLPIDELWLSSGSIYIGVLATGSRIETIPAGETVELRLSFTVSDAGVPSIPAPVFSMNPIATKAEAEAGTRNDRLMTPLRSQEALTANVANALARASSSAINSALGGTAPSSAVGAQLMDVQRIYDTRDTWDSWANKHWTIDNQTLTPGTNRTVTIPSGTTLDNYQYVVVIAGRNSNDGSETSIIRAADIDAGPLQTVYAFTTTNSSSGGNDRIATLQPLTGTVQNIGPGNIGARNYDQANNYQWGSILGLVNNKLLIMKPSGGTYPGGATYAVWSVNPTTGVADSTLWNGSIGIARMSAGTIVGTNVLMWINLGNQAVTNPLGHTYPGLWTTPVSNPSNHMTNRISSSTANIQAMVTVNSILYGISPTHLYRINTSGTWSLTSLGALGGDAIDGSLIGGSFVYGNSAYVASVTGYIYRLDITAVRLVRVALEGLASGVSMAGAWSGTGSVPYHVSDYYQVIYGTGKTTLTISPTRPGYIHRVIGLR